MSRKCESCRHYFSDPAIPGVEVCGSEDVLGQMVGVAEAIELSFGREICDREGDGHFVYFEPIEVDPSAGATFQSGSSDWNPVAIPLVQITREPRSMTAGGAA